MINITNAERVEFFKDEAEIYQRNSWMSCDEHVNKLVRERLGVKNRNDVEYVIYLMTKFEVLKSI